ncbi:MULTISPECIES: ABC transporter ATP-binding protein [unclassified Kitasatospora]|uniref:ABC transporter ATP-binding protein n=1 Tax=unclassified Kitasatospora TaxID=2633591 RepID=UPI00070D8904|nr:MULTISPECIES: ABC transporter ATP-binding protein [unclassified Kitasatospora]KQV12518.1 ABC transporter ATP-binding protein [Kitasatospora sp. Root107]KRB73630.1 ABC transporter ATP-binding protein [Kitasatospora sp. Root187]
MSPPTPPTGTLRIDRLQVTYGRAVQALRGVSLEVPAGEITAVLGSNGAGKSTLLRALSGTLALHRGVLDSGGVTLDGVPLTGDPAKAVAAGVVQVPEGRRVFADLTVEENLRAGGLGLGRRSAAGRRAAQERVFALLPVLAERRRQAAGLMSGGEQQMLALGRALMAEPRVLLLDEPSLGLAPMMVERIAGIVQRINAAGTTVLLVEQNAAVALRIAHRASVLENGLVRLTGSAEELAGNDEIRRLYLGAGESGPELVGPHRAKLGRWVG